MLPGYYLIRINYQKVGIKRFLLEEFGLLQVHRRTQVANQLTPGPSRILLLSKQAIGAGAPASIMVGPSYI